MKLASLAVFLAVCVAETHEATPAGFPTAVTSATMGVGWPARPAMVRGEKSYFAVEDPISKVCGPADALGGPSFARGASVLPANDEAGLRRIAMGPLSGRTLLLVGHADAGGGTQEQSYELGLRRAQRVRDALVVLGVKPDRIQVSSTEDLDVAGSVDIVLSE